MWANLRKGPTTHTGTFFSTREYSRDCHTTGKLRLWHHKYLLSFPHLLTKFRFQEPLPSPRATPSKWRPFSTTLRVYGPHGNEHGVNIRHVRRRKGQPPRNNRYLARTNQACTWHGQYTETLNLSGSATFDRVFLEIAPRAFLDFQDAYLGDGSS